MTISLHGMYTIQLRKGEFKRKHRRVSSIFPTLFTIFKCIEQVFHQLSVNHLRNALRKLLKS